MKKIYSLFMSSLLFGSMVVFSSCSSDEKKEFTTETSSMHLTVDFAKAAQSRATNFTPSVGVPTTSWGDNILKLQFFLYDANGVIRWAKTVDRNHYTTLSDNQADPDGWYFDGTKFGETFRDVPVGSFTLIAVANVDRNVSNVRTTFGRNGMTSTLQDVDYSDAFIDNTNVDELFICHAWSQNQRFPDFYQDRLSYAVANSGRSNEYGRLEAGEVFRGFAEGVIITSTTEALASMEISRDVAMIRLRIDPSALAEIDGGEAKVDWTRNNAIFLSNVPQAIKMAHHVDNIGNVATPFNGNSISSSVVFIHNPSGCTFNTTEPTSGYEPGTQILTDGFTMWRDIIIFPNKCDDEVQGVETGGVVPAHDRHKYVLSISALGLPGHNCKDNDNLDADGNPTTVTLDAPTTVYWCAYLDLAMASNNVYEYNITFDNGGQTPLPNRPDISSMGLNVNFVTLRPWNSAIVSTDLVL
ncbi:MAG: hypothetical protein K2H44_07985 [Muribaculaceae bacterium]|nr:hypothetical protein [Muribaculaceae bacterium]